MNKIVWGICGVVLIAGGVLPLAGLASAERYTSPNYTIDASVGNSFGGDNSSSSYKLTSSGGESIIGSGQGGSYKLTQGYVAQLERSLQLAVQPSGLNAAFTLDEQNGAIAYDSSSNSNNGTAVNATVGQPGKVNTSYAFSANKSVELGNPVAQQITGDQTIEMWLKPANFNFRYNPYSKAYGGEGTIVQEPGGRLTYYYGTAGDNDWPYYEVSSTGAIPLNTWSHVAVVRNIQAGEILWYINGQLDTMVADAYLSATASSLPAYIGDGYVGNYEGSIDNFKLYSRALSATEVEAAYDSGQNGNATGLAFSETIIPNASQTVQADIIVQSDAPGYTLGVFQDNNLTSASSTIPGISSGTIASPTSWSEGTTKGLGFTLTSSNATPVPAKWNSGSSYAALPGASTSIYTRSGYTTGSKDVTTMKYRLDVSAAQPTGKYTNTVTYTGVMIP